jgi:hypothetical protein
MAVFFGRSEAMKSKRVITKIGDVFAVQINETIKKYFQLIAFDLTQLNSDGIRAFRPKYQLGDEPDLSTIVKGDVEFYAHCVTSLGVKLGLWQKVGKSNDTGVLDNILFTDTNDYARALGEESVTVSNRWYVWRIGDDDFKRVGKLQGENRKAEIGMVINPASVVHRMKTGEYDFPFYTRFE